VSDTLDALASLGVDLERNNNPDYLSRLNFLSRNTKFVFFVENIPLLYVDSSLSLFSAGLIESAQ
jgi:hypothetical protein